MSSYVSLLRVKRGILSLREWRSLVDSQGAMHLIHFLAAKRGNVRPGQWTDYGEAQDKAFCDEVMWVRPGDRPYYDPLDDSFRIHSHFHSNVATARKKTFADRWQAAEYRLNLGQEQWRFTDGYLKIMQDKVLSKSGVTTQVPVFDLLAWMYRARELPDNASLEHLFQLFQTEYHLSVAERESLFAETNLDGSPVSQAGFFVPHAPSNALFLELAKNVGNFDLSDALAEAGEQEDRPTVNAESIADMVRGGRKQIILQGPPGTGKTYLAKKAAAEILGISSDRDSMDSLFLDPGADEIRDDIRSRGGWALVQFHPGFSYEDFVRGISAEVGESGPVFGVRDRIFLRACNAASESNGPIVLIIDEINRADLSKVLGELIYALEYRGEPVGLQYVKEGSSTIRLPDNLIVIGTMNTADHAIAHIDYAIRRRFDFVDVSPDPSVIRGVKREDVVTANALHLFSAVTSLLESQPAKSPGHAYFLAESSEGLASAIVFQLLPLLADYRREGVLPEIEALRVPGWPGESGIPLVHERPFDLVDQVTNWLREEHSEDVK